MSVNVPPDARRAWIEIDTAALRRNAESVIRHSGARILPMVKADAYGTGVGPALRALEPLEPWGYGVATVAEGEELRALGIERPVVLFTPALLEEHARARAAGLTLALGDARNIEAWATAGGEWHLAIDTGMGRAGVDWRHLDPLRDAIRRHPPSAAFTHFHSAEDAPASIVEQEWRFAEALAAIDDTPALLHTDNSAAIVRRGASTHPLVRPGIFLYGAGSFTGATITPEPVVSVRARVVDVRDAAGGDTISYGATHRVPGRSRIATVAYGHSDGYPIASSGKGIALLRGETVRVVGRVTMDMTMLDVTDVQCDRGDVITFVGRDDDRLLTVDQVSATAGVSPYEFLVRLRNRMPRYYLND